MPGTWEWIIIFAVILILFGAKKLPEIARSLGKGIKEFKKAARDIGEDLNLDEKKSKTQEKPETDSSAKPEE